MKKTKNIALSEQF